MALIKKDYGLIYNDDGSLCVTVRDDDVPFEGVKSYAIEESTENLLPSNLANFEDLNWISNNIVSREIIKGGGFNGRNAVKIVKDDTQINFQIAVADVRTKILNNIQVGDRISYQIKYKIIDPGSGGTFNFRTWGFSGSYPRNEIDIGNGWKLRYGTSPEWTDASDLTGEIGISELPPNSTILFCDFQVEIKPYSTSFVDGSRPDGNLKLPVDLASMDNFALNFWVKMNPYYLENHRKFFAIADHRGQLNWNFLMQIRCYTPNLPYIVLSKRENGTISQTDTYENANLALNWSMITLVYDNGVVKMYYNGVKVVENNFIIPNDYGSNKLFIGHSAGSLWAGETGGMGIVSNLFIGEYKDKNGNVIWTDEYIQEVYEAKKPFNTNL